MTEEAVSRLTYLCSIIPPILSAIPDKELLLKPSVDKWSKKILGHLIDSAANNHQRFIRVQCEDTPQTFYDQNKWVKFNNYQQAEKDNLVALWAYYNKQLIEVNKRIPENYLAKECRMRDGHRITLSW